MSEQQHREQVRLRDACDPRRLRARRGDRGGHPADLRDQHLQAGRRGRPARRLRVQPLRQPDPHRARGQHRGAGGGRARLRVRLRPGRRGHPGPRAVPARRPRGDPGRRVRRHLPALRQGREGLGPRAQPGAGLRPRAGARPRSARARPSWSGSRRPTNPLLNIGDIEALAADRPRRRRPAGRRQHLRLAVPPAAADPRRRRRRALDDEVLRRPLRRRRRRARGQATSTWPRRSPSTRTPWAPSPGPFDAWLTLRGLKTLGAADGAALRQRRARRRLPDQPPGGRRGDLPRPRDPPRPRGRAAPDEAVRRHGVVPRRPAARRRRWRCASAPRSSRSASRSAASSR